MSLFKGNINSLTLPSLNIALLVGEECVLYSDTSSSSINELGRTTTHLIVRHFDQFSYK